MKMKRRVIVFICVVLFSLILVPIVNFKFGNAQQRKEGKWWSKTVLYNIDFAFPPVSYLLYPLGISINPMTIIGKNDWLYLGGSGESDARRRGSSADDADAAEKIGLTTDARANWLKLKGVRLYQVMLSPNKETIYPEFLPDWFTSAANSSSDTLMANVNPLFYVDTRPSLMAAKRQYTDPLYYKTDTHWNNLGAWVAYRAFALKVGSTQPELRWLSEQQVQISKAKERQGGDLANFLRLKGLLRDSEIDIEIVTEHPIETEHQDFESGRLISSGGNPAVGISMHPLLVKSEYALNQVKVLWLRDSFGGAMSRLMAATFKETLQIHYNATDSDQFAKFVETFKPDYVFITVVERGSREVWFQKFTPTTISDVTGNASPAKP